MICPKCNNENVNIQTTTEVQIKDKKHGCFWWCCVGWWWIPCKWLFFTLPALIVKIFKRKKQKVKNITKTVAVCQNCGYHWEV